MRAGFAQRRAVDFHPQPLFLFPFMGLGYNIFVNFFSHKFVSKYALIYF
jgi:hypothetical protein